VGTPATTKFGGMWEFGQLRQAIGQAQEALQAVQQQVQASQTDTQQWQAHHAEATQALAALQDNAQPWPQT
jgi:hypothetical protein